VVLVREEGGYAKRKTDTELWEQQTITLDGFLESGPRNYRIICQAIFPGGFLDDLEAEEWAKNNIIKVVYEATYVKY
jgi:hypothetical protein